MQSDVSAASRWIYRCVVKHTMHWSLRLVVMKTFKRMQSDGRYGLTVAVSVLAGVLSGCAGAQMIEGGSLSSYDGLAPSNGVLTKSLVHVDKDRVLAAKTLRIMPTAFAQTASPSLSDKQRVLVANAVDRALCVGLSDRFEVVLASEPADLTVSASVTHAAPTDKVAAGASKVVSIIPTILSVGAPVPVPRIPIGLGGLVIEAEAKDVAGKQQAAMVWARDADMVTSSPKVSEDGDAYDLAKAFGGDFSHLLVTGKSPFGDMPNLPSFQQISSSLGGKPKYAACENFGRDPGVTGLVAAHIGLPPEWTDSAGADGKQ